MVSGRKLKLVDYFKKNLKKGYPEESLRWALINQGFSKFLVDEALRDAKKELAAKAPVLKEKPVITYEIYDKDNKLIDIKKPWWKRFMKK